MVCNCNAQKEKKKRKRKFPPTPPYKEKEYKEKEKTHHHRACARREKNNFWFCSWVKESGDVIYPRGAGPRVWGASQMLKIIKFDIFLPKYLVGIKFDIIFAASLTIKGGGNTINSAPEQ